MKKVFIDVNIFMDFIDKDREFDPKTNKKMKNFNDLHKKAHEMFLFLTKNNIEICLSEDEITNIIYNLRNKEDLIDNFMNFLNDIREYENLNILHFGYNVINNTTKYYFECKKQNKKIDIEDTLQYFCALENKCDTIITNDKNFPKLDIALKRTNPNLEDYNPL